MCLHLDQWARFRLMVIGELLAAPPNVGELQQHLDRLAHKQWEHPITKRPMRIGFSTIERWFYLGRDHSNPIEVLRQKPRQRKGHGQLIHTALEAAILRQFKEHPSWSYQLHYDNLIVRAEENLALAPLPSYATVRRFMRQRGLHKQPRKKGRRGHLDDATARRLETLSRRERRGYESPCVGSLWHSDFHHGSLPVITPAGYWVTPKLFCVLDDHCRVVGHIQWYYHETAETFIHGLSQAFLKWGLPYKLMTDNGPAMIARETEQGITDLSINHALTLPYSPQMNAKQESFWNRLESHLCAMLENHPQLTLDLLNRATHAWIQFEYHVTKHDELDMSPLARMESSTSVLRPRPEPDTLERLFTAVVKRSQRRSDGTVSYENVRYEVPSIYRHQKRLTLRARRWDKSWVYLYDQANAAFLERIYPVDKQDNADGRRRVLPTPEPSIVPDPDTPLEPIAPKLQKYLNAMDAQGLAPPFICLREQPPTDDQQSGEENENQTR